MFYRISKVYLLHPRRLDTASQSSAELLDPFNEHKWTSRYLMKKHMTACNKDQLHCIRGPQGFVHLSTAGSSPTISMSCLIRLGGRSRRDHRATNLCIERHNILSCFRGRPSRLGKNVRSRQLNYWN